MKIASFDITDRKSKIKIGLTSQSLRANNKVHTI